MHHIITALIASALFLSPITSFAAEQNSAVSGAPAETAKVPAKAASGKKAVAATKKKALPASRLVDINSASKVELKKLPGVGDSEADKIIAGRPYLTKARLVTHAVISADLYERIRKLIIAKQK